MTQLCYKNNIEECRHMSNIIITSSSDCHNTLDNSGQKQDSADTGLISHIIDKDCQLMNHECWETGCPKRNVST